MNPGDSLFVYTDGAREAMNAQKQLFGTERMLEALNENPDAAPDEAISRMTKRTAVRSVLGTRSPRCMRLRM